MTFWVKPKSSIEALPEAQALVRDLLELFYEYFPEYEGCLGFSQSPRRPRYLFLYMEGPCGGSFPPPPGFCGSSSDRLPPGRGAGLRQALALAALLHQPPLLLDPLPGVHHPGQDEEEVGKPVQVADHLGVHRLLPAQGHRLALGAAHHGAGEVKRGRRRVPSREDKALEGGLSSW